jgi:pilus assembly protein Flp/PilA
MTKFRTLMTRIRHDEDGATAIEYGLLAALVAVAIIIAVAAIGTELNNAFTFVADELETSNTANIP